MLSARFSHRSSVRSSVCQMGGSVKSHAS